MIRRTVDIAAAGAGLLLLSPVLVVIMVLVAVTSPGGALFTQERVGRGGRRFRLLKFRTMRSSSGGPEVTAAGDSRITTIGHFLRRIKLDELPQLWNVLRGDMSLVGPRPEVARYVALYPPPLRDAVLSVRPGITDPLSLELFDESALLACSDDPERYYVEVMLPWKVERQALYVSSRTLSGDFTIILLTIARVLGLTKSVPEAAVPQSTSATDQTLS